MCNRVRLLICRQRVTICIIHLLGKSLTNTSKRLEINTNIFHRLIPRQRLLSSSQDMHAPTHHTPYTNTSNSHLHTNKAHRARPARCGYSLITPFPFRQSFSGVNPPPERGTTRTPRKSHRKAIKIKFYFAVHFFRRPISAFVGVFSHSMPHQLNRNGGKRKAQYQSAVWHNGAYPSRDCQTSLKIHYQFLGV